MRINPMDGEIYETEFDGSTDILSCADEGSVGYLLLFMISN